MKHWQKWHRAPLVAVRLRGRRRKEGGSYEKCAEKLYYHEVVGGDGSGRGPGPPPPELGHWQPAYHEAVECEIPDTRGY